MSDDTSYVSLLPEHPALREIALMIDEIGMWGEILDHRFRSVFVYWDRDRAFADLDLAG